MDELKEIYKADIKIRENCVICGKPLKKNEGLFICNECKNKKEKDNKEKDNKENDN